MKLLFLFYNILFLSLPLAIFEIIIEKDKGWGGGWNKTKWCAKPFAPNSKLTRFLVKILKVETPLNYHLLMFAVVFPIIFIAQYVFITHNILLLFTAFITVILFEDVLWFAINWNFDSFKQLLKGPNGSIWWHKSWVKISSHNYLPTSYFIWPILVVILYLLAQRYN